MSTNAERKRKERSTIKYWEAPFLCHKYRSHHATQHKAAWEHYQTLSPEGKESFFEGRQSVMNTMHWHMDTQTDSITLKVNASIVETIIGDLFFRDDAPADVDASDVDGNDDGVQADERAATKKRREKDNAMKLFTKEDDQTYVATIRNSTRFHLAVDHVSTGMSFRQVALAIQHAKDRLKAAKLLGINEHIVGQYVRVMVGAALQQIACMLSDDSVWAFSLSADGSTHLGQPFFDKRIRICYQGALLNLHLVALPSFERHTSENLYDMIVKFLDALYPMWRRKLLSMSSDGENVMTGRHSGVVTRIAACAENKVLRVWCAPHQIDIVVKSTAEGIAGGEWVQKVYSLSVFLRAQSNLIVGMGVKCPKKTNRWAHLGRVLTFYKTYRRKIIEYIEEERRHAYMPTDMWWVITFAVSPAVDVINVTFAQLQTKELLVAQQEEHIEVLIGSLTTMFAIETVDAYSQEEEEEDGDDSPFVCLGDMRVHSNDIVSHIRDQGSFAGSCYDRLSMHDSKQVVHEIGTYAMRLVTRLMSVKAARDENNEPLDRDELPVLPSQLVSMRTATFIKDVLDPYRSHLAVSWSAEKVDEVENEHRSMRVLYESDAATRNAIDSTGNKTSFDEAWDQIPPRFSNLRSFCGGLATVFPNTTAVEGDFSILKWEMDEFRANLMHLSLEGIFQAKQRYLLGLT